MNYAAINAKLCAMGARGYASQDDESINQTVTNICRYIPSKAHKSFIAAMAGQHERGLDYYTSQWKQLNRLDKPNRTALRRLLGMEIDLNNILWMYRLKRYHRITGDTTFGYLVPIRYRLSREATRRMVDCVTPQALLDEVALGPYSADFVHLNTTSPLNQPTPEQILTNAISRRYQAAARRFPNTLVPVLAYLYKIR